MSVDFFFISVLILAGVLTIFSMMRPEILLRMCAALCWLSLAFWTLLSGNLDTTKSWVVLLEAVFIVMCFVPLVFQINTEIWREHKGRRWLEWGRKPKDDTEPSVYEQHRQRMREMINRKIGG